VLRLLDDIATSETETVLLDQLRSEAAERGERYRREETALMRER
jgi:hypothetical protein